MIRVLIVDDSPVVRNVFEQSLNADSEIEVVATAPDAYVARDLIVQHQPDVVVLDIDMPRMDGLTFLKKLMKYYPLPVVIASGLTDRGSQLALDALQAGAVEVVSKGGAKLPGESAAMELLYKVKAAALVDVKRRNAIATATVAAIPAAPAPRSYGRIASDRLIAIGASTGGTEALEAVLKGLPEDCPPIVIVQHMPAKFTAQFARRLNASCRPTVAEAQGGERLEQGHVFICPGDDHMVVMGRSAPYTISLRSGPLVNRHRPSVDVLFKSVARSSGSRTVAALLTGMGKDGAQGLLEIRNTGARTICQDEATSIVFGMPREGIEIGAAEFVCPLQDISGKLMELASQSARKAA
ncbi:MAG: chemotaxis response regulator protein-glutamate methylesterase [Candidatus Eisenbacteria bacterium]|uniref:Protein-glutamate methylesterase/protein-glutamine glutaminase n=1 Tax=Eiseniibacteriota bacterium TaxID=2212470 RepID=A0A956SGI1_UNCEI|nr:chemotaxis response regulator protein-glutamate methylesterase [Candidatus Eisenbacteria bacterium]